MTGLNIQILEQQPPIPLEEKRRLVGMAPILWYQDQLRILRSISEMDKGTNMTPFNTVSVLGTRLLVIPDQLAQYHEHFYRRVEGWIVCQKGRRRRVYWIEPKLELLEGVMHHERERDAEIGRQCDKYMKGRTALQAGAPKPQADQKDEGQEVQPEQKGNKS